MDSINDVHVWVFPFSWFLITDEVGHMSLNCMSFDLDRYDTIVFGWYLKGWFYTSNIYLLFTVSGVGKKFTLLLYVAILFFVPGIGQGEFPLHIIANSSSISGRLSLMMKLCGNIKSPIWSWSVVIPTAVIGDQSIVFSCIEVACIAVYKLLSMAWYIEYLTRDIAAPESIKAL